MAKKQSGPSPTGLLTAVPLFSRCTKKELDVVASTGRLQNRKAGDEVVREGRSGAAFFLILSGSVDVDRSGQLVARLMPGDFFGELALITDQRRSATVTVVEDAELFALSKFSFKSMLLNNPKICYGMLEVLAARSISG